jgi:hypothetical protein
VRQARGGKRHARSARGIEQHAVEVDHAS